MKQDGKVVSWGWDKRNGCLGLGQDSKGENITSTDIPREITIGKCEECEDIQMGRDHVVALSTTGAVYCWGDNSKGQLGQLSPNDADKQWQPQLVAGLSKEQIVQIAVVNNSSFALSANGSVFAWGDNKDNVLGLEDPNKMHENEPVRLQLLASLPVRKLEVFEGRTIIAHVRTPESTQGQYGIEGPIMQKESDEPQPEIFKGLEALKRTMETTQDYWTHLLSIKHGQPYDAGLDPGMGGSMGSIQDDLQVAQADLQRAERHINALFEASNADLADAHNSQGTRYVKFILCMFISDCLLRREKVKQAIVARQFAEAKKTPNEISAYSVTDFGNNANEEIRRIIAVTTELDTMLKNVKHIEPVDMMSLELKLSIIECLEVKLQLHETRIELLKAAEAKPSDPMLPALRTLKDRWDTLKRHSLYRMYKESKEEKMDFSNDDEHLKHLVKKSNSNIDEMLLLLDKDKFISHDTLVPALCYDLLRENAELRKMTNKYQLHVLMLHEGYQISGPMAAGNTNNRQLTN